jgi:hypothetical protein
MLLNQSDYLEVNWYFDKPATHTGLGDRPPTDNENIIMKQTSDSVTVFY